MTKLHHGVRLYAVDSRTVGTFGGRAARATVKIYDGSNANTPRTMISGARVEEFRQAVPGDRDGIERYLRQLLPSNDPYRLPPGYSYATDGRCHNAEPGTYSHECGKPAVWIGTKASGFASGYCDDCKQHGAEARGCSWERVVTREAAP